MIYQGDQGKFVLCKPREPKFSGFFLFNSRVAQGSVAGCLYHQGRGFKSLHDYKCAVNIDGKCANLISSKSGIVTRMAYYFTFTNSISESHHLGSLYTGAFPMNLGVSLIGASSSSSMTFGAIPSSSNQSSMTAGST